MLNSRNQGAMLSPSESAGGNYIFPPPPEESEGATSQEAEKQLMTESQEIVKARMNLDSKDNPKRISS